MGKKSKKQEVEEEIVNQIEDHEYIKSEEDKIAHQLYTEYMDETLMLDYEREMGNFLSPSLVDLGKDDS